MTISTTPAPDPYAVLGVSKDATTAEIRTSYKKLALKCHPDRIQDEAKRDQGKDEFQKVQEAYELLSDEHKRAKYDLKAQHAAEAKKSTPADKGSPSSSSSSSYFKTTSFEYRGGKLYEEKTFVRRHDEEPATFSEEPRASSRKYDGYERKHSAKEPEEKRKSKSSESSSKSKLRESQRSSRKTKDKERKREQSEKQNTRNAYTVTDDESQPERDYTRSPRQRPSHERREDPSKWSSPKYVFIEDNALGYIQRSKAAMSPEPERRGSYPMSSPPVYYDSLEAVVGDTARRSSARPLRRSGPDLRATYEVVDSPLRGRPTPRKAASSSNGIRVATGSRGPARSSTTTYEVKNPKGIPTLRRAETAPHPPHVSEPLLPRSSRPGERRYDSGYSSPGTPDFHGSPPKSSSKFTIIDEDDDFPRRHRTVIVEQPYRRHQSVSPSRRVTPIATLRATSRPAQARGRTVPNVRAESARVVPSRGSPPLRHGSSGLFGEVSSEEYKFTPEQVRYSPRIRQEDVRFSSESYRPGVMRKESYAY